MSGEFDFGNWDEDISPDTGVNMDDMDMPGFEDEDIDFGLPAQPTQNMTQESRHIQTNQNVGDLSFESDQQQAASTGNNKKIALIAIAIGTVVILLCMLLFNLSSRAKQNKQNELDNTPQNNQQQEVYQEPSNGVNDDAVQNQPDNSGDLQDTSNNQNSDNNQAVAPDTNYNSGSTSDNQGTVNNSTDTTSEEWVQFELAGTLNFETTVDSELTVTSIRHFAKVLNSQNDKIVKSIVTGNIGGLVGTFDIELPYYKAVMLQPGTLLKVQYRCTIQNGTKVIGEIIFV